MSSMFAGNFMLKFTVSSECSLCMSREVLFDANLINFQLSSCFQNIAILNCDAVILSKVCCVLFRTLKVIPLFMMQLQRGVKIW